MAGLLHWMTIAYSVSVKYKGFHFQSIEVSIIIVTL